MTNRIKNSLRLFSSLETVKAFSVMNAEASFKKKKATHVANFEGNQHKKATLGLCTTKVQELFGVNSGKTPSKPSKN